MSHWLTSEKLPTVNEFLFGRTAVAHPCAYCPNPVYDYGDVGYVHFCALFAPSGDPALTDA